MLTNKKNEAFLEVFEEYVFLFQMETGFILQLKPNIGRDSQKSFSDEFYFDVMSMALKPLASYRSEPQKGNLFLQKNINATPAELASIKKSFDGFLVNARLKTLFA